ncbi:MAG: hypothetical protein Q7T93_08670 [Methylobacterium sp.]|jgi:hypothetical protein|uniref:hypothetical protein n=1 Tax=unclassified Methylobacterium TaxID=2615210 RepID=UPI0011CCBA02|nr:MULTISPECIES: hypothetical protein [unclassified Methylobacterium]MDO9426896.1 hypothetical protein [Methylobacterium sp.]TXM74018.1 hypothetical protein FV218_10560 [Methylobacterium sp. WL69]
MRRTLFTGVLLLVPAGAAVAQARLATPDMTCAEAAGLVTRTGAIVLTTGPFTYARLVRDGGFCPLPEVPKPAFEATRDAARCFVGYTCHDRFTEGAGRE